MTQYAAVPVVLAIYTASAYVPAAPLPILLPAVAWESSREAGPKPWTPVPTWETLMGPLWPFWEVKQWIDLFLCLPSLL